MAIPIWLILGIAQWTKNSLNMSQFNNENIYIASNVVAELIFNL